MSVVFTDNFTVAVDTDIDAYPAGTPDYAYNAGSGANLQVMEAVDNVQATSQFTNFVARIINPAVPTSDQKITVTIGVVALTDDRGQLAVRCNASGSANFYLGLTDSTGSKLRIYRCDTGSFTLLAETAWTPSGGAHTLLFQAVGSASVDLTLTFDGTTTVTHSDVSGDRKTSGPPGISVYCNIVSANAYVDNLSVDNLISQTVLNSLTLLKVGS